MKTTVGSDTYEMVRAGLLKECSFAFQVEPGGEEWSDETVDGVETPLRIVKRAQLFDVSVVQAPAYPGDNTGVSVSSMSPMVMGRSIFPEGIPMEVRSHVPNLRISNAQQRNRAFVERMLSL